MKKHLIRLISALFALSLLAGCAGQSPKEVTVDSSFVIVSSEETQQAALSLQTAITQNTLLTPEIVTKAGGKSITLQITDNLAEGQYRTRLTKSGIVIEAQSELALVMGMRAIRQAWLVPSSAEGEECQDWVLKPETLTLTADQCAQLSGTIDMANAPFLVLTQNIRYADDEGGNMVVQRAPRFNKLVQEYQPDILCIQEDNRVWVPILQKLLESNYTGHGMFNGDPERSNGQSGNYQSIYFRTDRYELLEQGGFWLTGTPNEFSMVEGGKSVRSCTWVLLQDKLTNQPLLVCNVHLDNSSKAVRQTQLNYLLEHMGSYMDEYPTAFCGDFNARPDSEVYQLALTRFSDPQESAKINLSTTDVTFTRYGTAAYGTDDEPRRLDYMFYNSQLTANTYRILSDQYDGYISDHFGAITEYSFLP